MAQFVEFDIPTRDSFGSSEPIFSFGDSNSIQPIAITSILPYIGGQNISDFQIKNDLEFFLLRPENFIDSCVPNNRMTFIYDMVNKKMIYETIQTPLGKERTFLEILSNALDNLKRSRLAKIDPLRIEVTVDRRVICIKNYGFPLRLDFHGEYNMYIPQMIFGHFKAGSNYNDTEERSLIGRNGIGAKATNAMSHKFEVDICNDEQKARYKQVWSKNMSEMGPPEITPYEGNGISSVQITYELDQARFQNEEYTNEDIYLFYRYCIDSSFSCKIPIVFNGNEISCQDIKDFAKICFSLDDSVDMITHYEWPIGTQLNSKKKPIDKSVIPVLEICMADTPRFGSILSFVNGLPTRDGGVHVDSFFNIIGPHILDTINTGKPHLTIAEGEGVGDDEDPVNAESNNETKKPHVKRNTGPGANAKVSRKAVKAMGAKSTSDKKKAEDKQKKKFLLSLDDLKGNISVIINVVVDKPTFNTQSKTKLAWPTPRLMLHKNFLVPLSQWKLIVELRRLLEQKNAKLLNKKTGAGISFGPTKITRANKAGGKDSMKCVLIGAEGDSAMGFVNQALKALGGRDYVGTIPFNGKCLNFLSIKNIFKIERSKVYNCIVKALGLKEGVDYSVPENRQSLNYGHFLIMADPDVDGKHICGLILNLFYARFSQLLLNTDFFLMIRTPIVIATEKRAPHEELYFYTEYQFSSWMTSARSSVNNTSSSARSSVNNSSSARSSVNNSSSARSSNSSSAAAKPQGIDTKYNFKYFKGLGTFKDSMIDKYMASGVKQVFFQADREIDYSMNLAFNPLKEFVEKRKKWLADFQPVGGIEELIVLPISHFINYEFIEYAFANLRRCIPGPDGLKESQRKILYGTRKKFGKLLVKGKKIEEMKVAQLGSYVAGKTNYHHGELILGVTITGMAQTFVGALNVPYLQPEGQFGSRIQGGKDAANQRYIYTMPGHLLGYILLDIDKDMVDFVEEEGKSWEPKFYLPILPMHVINGILGIATAWSTFIPNHSPVEIAKWYLARLELTSGESLRSKVPLPWYRGFNGFIRVNDRTEKTTRSKKAQLQQTNLLVDPEQVESEADQSDDDDDIAVQEPVVDGLHQMNDINPEEAPEAALGPREMFAEPNGKAKITLETYGLFNIIAQHPPKEEGGLFEYDIIITELPISIWMINYKCWLDYLQKEKKLKDYKFLGDKIVFSFEIYGWKSKTAPTIKDLRLKKSFGMTNMVLLNEVNAPRKYATVYDLLEEYYIFRLPYYEKRKRAIIASMEKDMYDIYYRILFIQNYLSGTLQIAGRKKADVVADMTTLGIPEEIAKKTHFFNLTEEDMLEHKGKLEEMKQKHANLNGLVPQQMWKEDIENFLQAYFKLYPESIQPGAEVSKIYHPRRKHTDEEKAAINLQLASTFSKIDFTTNRSHINFSRIASEGQKRKPRAGAAAATVIQGEFPIIASSPTVTFDF